MPRPEGIKITKPSKSKGYKCANETYCKYGKEISIRDYVNEGKEGTIAKEIIEKAGGLSVLREKMKETDATETSINMNLDLFTVNQMLKCGKIAQKKIDKEIEIQKEINQIKQEIKGSENE